MQIKTQSVRSLSFLALILLLIGAGIGAPIASALAFGLAFVCAAFPAIFCQGRPRLFAMAVALLAGFAAVATYLKGDPAYDAYLERARKNSSGVSSTADAPNNQATTTFSK